MEEKHNIVRQKEPLPLTFREEKGLIVEVPGIEPGSVQDPSVLLRV